MTTSYEELTPDQRQQVEAFMNEIKAALYWEGSSGAYIQDYVREHVSNLVLSCLFIETRQEVWKQGAIHGDEEKLWGGGKTRRKSDPGSVVLTSREWKSLSRAYSNLYTLLTDQPGYLGDSFVGQKEEYQEVVEWAERLDEEMPD